MASARQIDTVTDNLDASGATMEDLLARAAPSVGEIASAEPAFAEVSSFKTFGRFARLLALRATYGRKPSSQHALAMLRWQLPITFRSTTVADYYEHIYMFTYL